VGGQWEAGCPGWARAMAEMNSHHASTIILRQRTHTLVTYELLRTRC